MNDPWTYYGRTWKEFREERVGRLVGLIVDVPNESAEPLLIGDVSHTGGHCGDCALMAIQDSDIVARYRQGPTRTLENLVTYCREVRDAAGELFESHIRTMLEQDGWLP